MKSMKTIKKTWRKPFMSVYARILTEGGSKAGDESIGVTFPM